MEKPDYVYRLAGPDEWFIAEETGVVPGRDIDHRDGYLHLSLRDQVLPTADKHFADAEELLAMEIPFERVADLIKFEMAPSRGVEFPHLYGALRAEHVTKTIKLVRRDGRWTFGDKK